MDDLTIAKKYTTKAYRAEHGGHEFTLTFQQFKKLMNTKRCYYTGVLLTDMKNKDALPPKYRTIDRIDSTVGYIPDNVVVCAHAVNHFKSIWESPSSFLTKSLVKKLLNKL